MGGIRNREAKRAANKVFTSGGGGGSKGPSVVDKRGQELPCPHCDRIFKQSDRLKQHIEKQHAAGGAGDGSSSDDNEDAAPSKTPAAVAAAVPASATKPATASLQQYVPAPATGPKMMDVNSKAGFYEVKSPKLLLHEWCLREKAPRPRYRVISMPGGLWKCKVRCGRAPAWWAG